LIRMPRRSWFKRRWLWIVLGITFFLIIGGGAYLLYDVLHVPSSPTELVPGDHVGQLAPEFVLPDLTGQNVSLSEFRGRLVILDFWASWCVPCRAFMPELHNLYDRYRDHGVVFVGVSLDRSEDAAKTYLAANGYEKLIALWGSFRQAQNVAARYGVVGIPHTYIIDRDGIIRYSGHPKDLGAEVIEAWL
jgi:thiol-disulfide isomerase/thioredoxin